jgi:hypothetical protein
VPAFVLSEQFARPYAISFKKVAPSGKIPTMVVSFSTVGDSSGVPRDVAAAVLKDLLQRLGEQAVPAVWSHRQLFLDACLRHVRTVASCIARWHRCKLYCQMAHCTLC